MSLSLATSSRGGGGAGFIAESAYGQRLHELMQFSRVQWLAGQDTVGRLRADNISLSKQRTDGSASLEFDESEDLPSQIQSTGTLDEGLCYQFFRVANSDAQARLVDDQNPFTVIANSKIENAGWGPALYFFGFHETSTAPDVFQSTADWISDGHDAAGVYFNSDEGDTEIQLVVCNGTVVTKYSTGVTPEDDKFYRFILDFDGSDMTLTVFDRAGDVLGSASSDGSYPKGSMFMYTGARTKVAGNDIALRHYEYLLFNR